MRFWGKILIGGGAVITLLVVIALGIVRLSIDPEAYRAEIVSAVSRAVGRPVTIGGPIHMAAFPWLSVRFNDVEIANAQGFGDRPMAHIDQADISLRVWPLFTGRLGLGTLTFDGLNLHLIRKAAGQTNWQGIVHHLSGQSWGGRPAGAPVRRSPDPSRMLPVSSLRISAVDIQSARIRYDDAVTDRVYRLSNADLQTGRISNGHPFRLETSGDLSWSGSHLSAAIHVVSLIEPNVSDHFYRFSGLGVNVLARGAAVPGGLQEANLGASGDIDLEAGRFELENVTLQSAGLTLTGKIDGTGLNDQLSYNGRITVNEFSPRSIMQQLELAPPQTEAGSALTDASFDAQFNGTADAVHFKQIKARLDASTLVGTVDIHGFEARRYGFNLNLDTLDIDDYLPPGSAAQAQTSQPAETGGGAAQKAAEFDLALLRNLRMQGRLTIGSLTAAKLRISDAIADLSVADDVLHVSPLKADLYGGTVSLEGAVDAGAERPEYRVDGWLHQVGILPLLHDVVDSDRVQGTGSMELDLRAQGKQVAQLKRSLSGKLSFELTNGRLNGIDLAGMLLAAKAQSGNDQSNTHNQSDGTGFRRFGGRFEIADGIATGRDLRLLTPRFSGHGQGRYGLPHNRLDYTLTVVVPQQSDAALAPLVGWQWPVHLQGSLLAPDYHVDMQAAGPAEEPPPRANRDSAPVSNEAADHRAAGAGDA
ncbi:AsmA family protein [Salinisphaera sp. SPP-AMP-43]|uniref:AsmA family protein n=1 Tax=Salinisphaera sp. SPP-AMP-43 TaxID=3121288 RepID=UPI003C6E3C2A